MKLGFLDILLVNLCCQCEFILKKKQLEIYSNLEKEIDRKMEVLNLLNCEEELKKK